MKILLTGATGFLGNNLLRTLLNNDHDVTVTVRHTSDLRPIDSLSVEKFHVDLSNLSEINRALEGIDVLIHSAAMIQIGWSKLERSMAINEGGTRTLAEAARRRGIRMVHVSTVDTLAAGTPDEPADETCLQPSKPECSYVVSKRAAEFAFIEQVASGLDGVIVNPGFMVGPYDWKPSSGEMMLAIAKQNLPFAPAGGCSVADVRDVADGIVMAMHKGKAGERYILGGENMTYLELWKQMAEVVGRKAPKRVLPDWLAKLAGKGGDLAGRFSKEEPQVNSAATAMGQIFHYYSSDKAQKQLGYKIGSVETALKDAWDWFRAFGYV